MGKASSSKKVARAAKVASRPGTKRSYGWPLTIGAVIVVGVLLVVWSFGGDDDNSLRPRVGEHWHAAYGVYVCDEFLPPMSDTLGDKYGIHTHQDGLMHMHPADSRAAGTNATIGIFAEEVGMTVTDTSFTASGLEQKNGAKCGDETGKVQLYVWDSPDDDEPEIITEDIAGYSPRQDDTGWVLAFVAPGTEVPKPPAFDTVEAPSDETGLIPSTTSTTAASTTSTTASSTTSSTAAP
jgi:hypothetical protein